MSFDKDNTKTVEELLILWKKHARGDKLTTEESQVLNEALVNNSDLHTILKELQEN